MVFEFTDNDYNGTVLEKELIRKDEEKLKNLIDELKKTSYKNLCQKAGKAIMALKKGLDSMSDDSDEVTGLMVQFSKSALSIACTGMDSVPANKVDAYFDILKPYITDYEKYIDEARNDFEFLDIKNFSKEGYRIMKEFLLACENPFTESYPALIYTYIIALTVAGKVNEAGLDRIKKLEKDYINQLIKEGRLKTATIAYSNIDFRCYVQFKNAQVYKKVMKELSIKDDSGTVHPFLDIAKVFEDQRVDARFHSPHGYIFDTLNGNENLAFIYIHDNHKPEDYYEELKMYIFGAVMEYAGDDAIMISDYSDYDNDSGNWVTYYFGKSEDDWDMYLVEGEKGCRQHEVELNKYKRFFGARYNDFTEKQKNKLKTYACDVESLQYYGVSNGLYDGIFNYRRKLQTRKKVASKKKSFEREDVEDKITSTCNWCNTKIIRLTEKEIQFIEELKEKNSVTVPFEFDYEPESYDDEESEKEILASEFDLFGLPYDANQLKFPLKAELSYTIYQEYENTRNGVIEGKYVYESGTNFKKIMDDYQICKISDKNVCPCCGRDFLKTMKG